MKRSMAPVGSNKMSATFEARAYQFEASGEMDKAEETFFEWIEAEKCSAQARYEFAAFLARIGEHKRAKCMALESIKLDSYSFKSQRLLGCIYERDGDFQKAVEIYNFASTHLSAQASSRALGVMLCDQANLHFALDEIEKSIRSYKEGLKLYPACHMAHWDLGTILRNKGDFEGAQVHYDMAIQSNDVTQKQGEQYIEFLLNPAFNNRYDQMCQVAKFPCQMICMAVSSDLMFHHWSKLSPGLRRFVRNICSTVFQNVNQEYQTHFQEYRVAISQSDKFPGIVTEQVIAFLLGDPTTFQ